jgi:uncharacterized protein (TIGR02996 family)
MTTHDALFQAIRDNPDDNDVRLVYSDWLEEHDEPDRAEYIRAQIALLNMAPDDERHDDLTRRQAHLWNSRISAWCKERVPGLQFTGGERGFPETVLGTREAFLSNAERLWEFCPVLRWWLTERAAWSLEEMHQLAAAPQLAYLTGIYINSVPLNLDSFRVLITSPHWERLHELRLTYCSLSRDAALVLAASPVLGQLTKLNLRANHIQAPGLQALLNSSYFARVTDLNVAGSFQNGPTANIGSDGAIALATNPVTERLRCLDLRANLLGNPGYEALLRSLYLDQVEHLYIGDNWGHDPSGERAVGPIRQDLLTRFGRRIHIDHD